MTRLDSEMTDIEMTKRCADAMGLKPCTEYRKDDSREFDPLYDDAQAMALVKKFALTVEPLVASNKGDAELTAWAGITKIFATDGMEWYVQTPPMEAGNGHRWDGLDADLNRAIVRCVAKMRTT